MYLRLCFEECFFDIIELDEAHPCELRGIPGLLRGICRERHIFPAFLVGLLIDALADGSLELQRALDGILVRFGTEVYRVGMEVEIEVVPALLKN